MRLLSFWYRRVRGGLVLVNAAARVVGLSVMVVGGVRIGGVSPWGAGREYGHIVKVGARIFG